VGGAGVSAIAIRPGRDADAPRLIALIAGVWAEYAGFVIDVDRELPELRAIADYMARKGGAFWVAEDAAGALVGSVGVLPGGEGGEGGGWELVKLYVARAARRHGLAARLVAMVEAHVAAAGGAFVHLWTDTRFQDAHAFYAARLYRRLPETRRVPDLSDTVEYHYRKDLAGGAP